MSMGRILVVEDKASMREMLALALQSAGYDVEEAPDGRAALRKIEAGAYDLVLSDLKMPRMDGMELLRASRETRRPPAFIMITAHGSIPDAVEAVNHGALDFIEKPFELDELEMKVAQAIGGHAPTQGAPLAGLIGDAAQMREIAELARRAADVELPLLITGEVGTGKRLLARLIHDMSERASRLCEVLECGALPADEREAAIFGATNAAAGKNRREHGRSETGAFERARGGVLILNDFELLPVSTQAKLLAAFQPLRGEATPGATAQGKGLNVERSANAPRVFCLSSADLPAKLRAGKLTADFYYRLRALELHLPPLRDRVEDIPALAEHFVRSADGARRPAFSPRALKLLQGYDWPGNVRELEALLERLAALEVEIVSENDLPEEIRRPAALDSRKGLIGDMEAIERERLREALERHGWNQTRAAKMLGIGRTALQYKMEKHRLHKPNG